MYAMLPPRQTYITQFCMVKVLLQVLQRKSFQPITVYLQISNLLRIMCGYQCDKAMTKNDTREVV